MSKRDERRMRLERRCAFLAERIKDCEVKVFDMCHDRAELSSLMWILQREQILFKLEQERINSEDKKWLKIIQQ